ncbi:MAG: response regulator [Acidobacteriota bacterium]
MKRVAVIEDNPDNRLLISALLEEHFEVLEYASGPEALERMPAELPNLVLLDISLPGMDGLEVLSRLRENPQLRDLPVIAVTAHAMSGDRERFLDHGFDDYLSKPILDDQMLVGLLQNWIERAAAASS